jgi:hypothetical protein
MVIPFDRGHKRAERRRAVRLDRRARLGFGARRWRRLARLALDLAPDEIGQIPQRRQMTDSAKQSIARQAEK